MKAILLSVILSSVVHSQRTSFVDLLALGPDYHVQISEKYISEIQCLRKLDALLRANWAGELKKMPTTDLGNLGEVRWEVKDSSYTKYNTLEEEWLMNDGSPVKRIEQCFRNLVPDVVPLMDHAEIHCLNDLFATHIVDEMDHQEQYERLLKATSREQLPFRKLISFTQLVEILFQNRSPDAMTALERVLYEHAESYLATDQDRDRPTYTESQDCEWINARALREVSGETAKLDEFISQVRGSVNKQVAAELVRNWNLNGTLPRDRYNRWLQARKAMKPRLDKEIEYLRIQRKDAQWLCEYATKLASQFANEQLGILLSEDRSWVHLEVSDVASKARAIEKALGKLNDFRHDAMRVIADKYEEGTRCMLGFLHLVQNHRKYDMAAAFIDEHYSYPELYCRGRSKNFGLVQVYFCNCIGSFCISHPLAALFADEYVIAQGSDGSYQVVRSGSTSKRKIIHCHILANGNKMSSLN